MDISQVRAAVAATHDPLTPQHVRAQAFQACEELKASFENCFHVAVQLVGVDQPDILRHFALHLLEHIVLSKWNSCVPEQKELIKRTALELLSGGARDHGEQAFVKNSIAKLVFEIAKREWPQNWTNLTDLLIEIGSKKEISLELVLCVLRDMADATVEFSFTLPERRRLELQQGLVVCLPQIFPLLQGALASQLRRLQADRSSAAALTLLQATFATLTAFAEWANDDFMLRQDFASDLCAALAIPELFLRCAPVMEKLLRGAAARHPEVMTLMVQHVIQVAGMLLAAPAEQQALYLPKAAELLLIASRAHFADMIVAHAATRDAFVRVLLPLFADANLRISTPAAQMWVALFRAHVAALAPPIAGQTAPACVLPADMQQPVVSELLRVCVRHSTRAKEDARDAFDNDDDFATAFGGFRSHLMTLIRALAALEPLFALQVAAEQLRAAIAYPAVAPTAASVAAGVFNARGQVTMSHPQYVAYEAACALLEIVLKQAPPALWQASGAGSSASASGAAAASGLPILEALLSQILSSPSAEPVLLGRQLYAIRLFIPLFQSNSAALSAALELLFASVTFTPPAEVVSAAALASGAAADVNAHLSDDTRATRRRACHSLIALAAAVPQHLLAIFQSLVQRVVQVAGMAETTDTERTSLFQFLVAASNGMPDRAQQRAFIADMTQQMLGELQNEALACALGSVHQFAAAFGLFQPEAGARGAPTVEFRIKFRSTVLNFAGILKGIQATDEERRDSALSTSAAAVSAELADADNDDGGGGDAVDFASSVSAAAAALLAVPQRDVSGAASTGVMLQAGWPLLQAILPQILQLVTMLHTLYTSQARQLMPAPLREVLALCREELAILHESDKAIKEKSIANAAAKAAAAGTVSPAERALQLHIGHCQSWLQSLRDSAYGILAAATLAGPALFQSYSPQALVASVFSHLDSMDARHLRMLIERFVTPLCANCPVEDYQRLLLPVLQVIITTVFGRLSTGWLMASDEDSEVNDLSVLEEMVEDRMLRDLTRAFGFFVANMCVPHAGYGVAGMTLSTSIAAANNARKCAQNSGGAAASAAGGGFRSSSHQDVFCAFVLANESLYAPLFAALTGCLCWPDNLAARRAITVLTRFIPLVVDRPPFHPIFANVLTAALRRLMPMRADEAQTCHAQVVVLVREIYFNFIKFSTMPRDVFASLPNMVVSDLQNFEEHLLSHTGSDKKTRMLCRQFLEKYVIGVGLPARDAAGALLDLPETLVLQSAKLKEAAPDWKEANTIGLQRLFQE